MPGSMTHSTSFYIKFSSLSFRERLTWLQAACCLVFIALGLKLLPFGQFKRVYAQLTSVRKTTSYPLSRMKEVAWAVRSAANHMPFRLLCLPQALALKFILRKSDSMVLHIGVGNGAGNEFLAHAWVEYKGEIIIGDWPENIVYNPIWVWE